MGLFSWILLALATFVGVNLAERFGWRSLLPLFYAACGFFSAIYYMRLLHIVYWRNNTYRPCCAARRKSRRSGRTDDYDRSLYFGGLCRLIFFGIFFAGGVPAYIISSFRDPGSLRLGQYPWSSPLTDPFVSDTFRGGQFKGRYDLYFSNLKLYNELVRDYWFNELPGDAKDIMIALTLDKNEKEEADRDPWAPGGQRVSVEQGRATAENGRVLSPRAFGGTSREAGLREAGVDITGVSSSSSSALSAVSSAASSVLERTTSSTEHTVIVHTRVSTDTPLEFCPTCRSWKIAHAHHDSVNRRCIADFDHHCPYVGNAVARRNKKSFLLFLVYGGVSALIALLTIFLDLVPGIIADAKLSTLISPRAWPWVSTLSRGFSQGVVRLGMRVPGLAKLGLRERVDSGDSGFSGTSGYSGLTEMTALRYQVPGEDESPERAGVDRSKNRMRAGEPPPVPSSSSPHKPTAASSSKNYSKTGSKTGSTATSKTTAVHHHPTGAVTTSKQHQLDYVPSPARSPSALKTISRFADRLDRSPDDGGKTRLWILIFTVGWWLLQLIFPVIMIVMEARLRGPFWWALFMTKDGQLAQEWESVGWRMVPT